MTREGEGLEGGEEGREGDFGEYARELREKYVETQGEKEKSEETTPIEQEEPEGRAEADKEEGVSDDFESYVRRLLQRYDAEPGEAQDERQAPELPVRHYGGAKTDSEAWVMHPPGEDDQWEDKMAKGSSDHVEGVTDAEEAREEGLDSKGVNAEISSNTESSTKSDGKDLMETNGGFEEDRQIDASESKLANRVREELDHLRKRINERHSSLSEVTDRSEVPHNPTMSEPILERTTRLDARSSQPENPSDRGIHQERVRGEEKVATRSEFNAGSLPTHEGKQRETPPQEGFLVAPRKGSETEASENHSIVSTLRGERSTNPRFFIANRLIEDATGEKLERGKEYELRGRIEGIGDFRMRHVERGESQMYVHVTKKEQSDKMKFGEKYVIKFDSARERREYNVVGTVEWPTLRVPGASVARMGFRDVKPPSERTVVDFRVRNLSASNEPTRRYFATYNPKADELSLRIGRAGAKPGDVMRVEEIREYRVGGFVRDFEEHRGEALKNVSMRLEKEGLMMDVDGRRFVLNEPHVYAFGLKATLSAKIESGGKLIRFQFDGDKVSGKLLRDSPILHFESEFGLAIRYDKGGNEIRTFRFFDKFDGKILFGKLRLVLSPNEEVGKYHAEADSWLAEHVRTRFSNINGKERLSREKGDISEEIARYMLSMNNRWEEIADHPYSKIREEGSRRGGPDSLQRLRSSGELYYFEFKWWGVTELAHAEARSQALEHLSSHPTYKGEKIAGAYIGILEWNPRGKDITLNVERVWSET